MTKILFICHGNICRSTMAEYVMKHLVQKNGLEHDVFIDSAATSTEEIGNGVHHGTRRKLAQVGIPCGDHRARQVTWADYQHFDLLIAVDVSDMGRMGTCSVLLEKAAATAQIDHHGTNPCFMQVNSVDAQAPATAVLVKLLVCE